MKNVSSLVVKKSSESCCLEMFFLGDDAVFLATDPAGFRNTSHAGVDSWSDHVPKDVSNGEKKRNNGITNSDGKLSGRNLCLMM